jgi:ATP-dependent Clp protease ATP-binding subunit ClpC
MFLKWHYTDGIHLYIKGWGEFLNVTLKTLSFPILLKTLFSPWKRLSVQSKGSGFNLKREFDDLTFNFTSRIIGFFVRAILIFASLVITFIMIVLGIFGLVLWFLVPVLSFASYQKMKKRPDYFAANLVQEILDSDDPIRVLFANEAGKYVLNHTSLDMNMLIQKSAHHTGLNLNKKYKGYADVLAHVLESGIWPSEFWREVEVLSEDLILAAAIWDGKRLIESGGYKSGSVQNVKGIGIQLLFGYTPILDRIGKELRLMESGARVLRGRSDAMTRIDRILSSKTSVLLVGQPGVGKNALLMAMAKEMDNDYKRLIDANVVELTAGIPDKDLRKVAIQSMFFEAGAAGNVILVIKDLPRLTNSSIEGVDYTDIFEEQLENKKLQIVAVTTPDEFERFLSRNYRLMKHFEKVDIEPLTSEAAMQVLIDKAADLENRMGVTIPIPVLRKMITTSEGFFSEVPFPKKALELLESSVTYARRAGRHMVTYDDVAQVASEKTGIPLTALTQKHREKLVNMESVMREKLIGQDTAIRMISQSLRTRTMGVGGRDKPVGTFLFLGPTGVGKTETAKVLSNLYYGHTNIMRFDMAEFIGFEGITKMIGSMHMNQPGVVTTAIRNNPAGMLLLDELEKASSEIFNVLLTLFDEGYIMDAFGRKIDCRNIFVIATSNAGSELIREMVMLGKSDTEMHGEILEHILRERIFAPEFVNRFDGVVVYEPLDQHSLAEIAKLKLTDLKKRMYEKNINLELHQHLHHKVAQDGYDPIFGARPMKRVVDMVIADIISQALLSDEIRPGDKILLKPGQNKLEYGWEKL